VVAVAVAAGGEGDGDGVFPAVAPGDGVALAVVGCGVPPAGLGAGWVAEAVATAGAVPVAAAVPAGVAVASGVGVGPASTRTTENGASKTWPSRTKCQIRAYWPARS
jgi:hypothetical protein